MPRRTTPKLSEALEQYLQIRAAHVAKSTLTNDRALLRKFVRDIGERTQVHLVTPEMLETWFAAEATRQTASSYNKVRSRTLVFFGFCARRGWLTGDPMGEIRTRRVEQRERLRLSADQLRALYETAEFPRDRGMLAVACSTGLRASDLTALTIGDVDLAQQTLRVHVQKTGKIDHLPLTLEADTELRRWLAHYAVRMARTDQALRDDWLLFPSTSVRDWRPDEIPGDPLPTTRLSHPARVVHRALERIGISTTADEGFHTIRRSLGRLVFDQASELGHDGALRLTAALLGHASSATTEIYLGLSHDRVKRDQLLRGRSLLGSAGANVVPIREVR